LRDSADAGSLDVGPACVARVTSFDVTAADFLADFERTLQCRRHRTVLAEIEGSGDGQQSEALRAVQAGRRRAFFPTIVEAGKTSAGPTPVDGRLQESAGRAGPEECRAPLDRRRQSPRPPLILLGPTATGGEGDSPIPGTHLLLAAVACPFLSTISSFPAQTPPDPPSGEAEAFVSKAEADLASNRTEYEAGCLGAGNLHQRRHELLLSESDTARGDRSAGVR